MTPVFHTMAGVIEGLTVNTLRKAVNAPAALNRFARPPACDSSGKVLQESGSDKPHYIRLHRSYDMAHLEPSLPVLGIQE
jgi:hypothetical protein